MPGECRPTVVPTLLYDAFNRGVRRSYGRIPAKELRMTDEQMLEARRARYRRIVDSDAEYWEKFRKRPANSRLQDMLRKALAEGKK